MLISDWSSAVCSSDLKAYVEHWPAFYAFLNGTPPGDPADYFTGDRLADLPGSIAQFAEQGLEVRGEPQLKPGQVQGDGDTAKRVDCQLDSASPAIGIASCRERVLQDV